MMFFLTWMFFTPSSSRQFFFLGRRQPLLVHLRRLTHRRRCFWRKGLKVSHDKSRRRRRLHSAHSFTKIDIQTKTRRFNLITISNKKVGARPKCKKRVLFVCRHLARSRRSCTEKRISAAHVRQSAWDRVSGPHHTSARRCADDVVAAVAAAWKKSIVMSRRLKTGFGRPDWDRRWWWRGGGGGRLNVKKWGEG